MEYARYGKGGPMISRLGFGLMRLPQDKEQEWGSVNYERSTEIIRASLAAGVNFFDSHHRYHLGKSETAFGKAMKGWKGHRVYIQTKTPWYNVEKEAYFKKFLYEALEKTGVESIDYLLTHALDMAAWKKRGKGFLRFTDWALGKGLIQHRGFSSHDSGENVKKFIDTGEFSAMLVSYNWMDPRQREVIGYASSKGMGVSVMNPLGGGALSTDTPQVMGLLPGAKTSAEIGMRFVLGTPGVVAAVSGMNKLEQLSENVQIACQKTTLTAKESRELQKKLGKINRQAQKFCTRCGYCMPCPAGVDIPENFGLYNRMQFFGQEGFAKVLYKRLQKHAKGNHSAESCKKCGRCLEKCPNEVPIIEQLMEVATRVGGAGK